MVTSATARVFAGGSDCFYVQGTHCGWVRNVQGGEATGFHPLGIYKLAEEGGSGDKARLLTQAGFGGGEPLRMDTFSGALYDSRYNQVVFQRIAR